MVFFKASSLFAIITSLPAILGIVPSPTLYQTGLGDGRMITPNLLQSLSQLVILNCLGGAHGVELTLSSPLLTVCICMVPIITPERSRCPACPANSSMLCVPGSEILGIAGGCACQCNSGYYLNSAGTCIARSARCPPPNVYTGGLLFDVCVCAPGWSADGTGGCVLGASNPARRRRAELKKKALLQSSDEFKCPNGERACKVGSAGGYECLDPFTSLESCGGCTSEGTGVNCLEIPGARGVGCLAGKCKIYSCFPGYVYSDSEGKCLKVHYDSKLPINA